MAKGISLSIAIAAAVAGVAFTGPSGAATPAAAGGPAPVGPLDQGLAARMQEAARNLQAGGDRLKATHALDAARRLARVKASLVGCPQAASSEPLKTLQAARRALQNGRSATAAAMLNRASASGAAGGGACAAGPSAVGKLAMNARGERIGRVESFSPNGQARLKVGGAINWFGFLDFGNDETTVPAGKLVEGKRMVVVLEG